MKIKHATLDTFDSEKDTVVVIDVLRAFTTAAYAFELGCVEIIVVSGIDEAFKTRAQFPGALLIGEADGMPIDGFDLDNSPTHLHHADLMGRRLILRSSRGAQGVVRSARANHILATGLCCIGATANRLQQIRPATVTLLQTGRQSGSGGDEDSACADLLEGLMGDAAPPVSQIVKRVRRSSAGQKFSDPAHPVFPAKDLDLALDIDRFDFAMTVEKRQGLPVLHPVYGPGKPHNRNTDAHITRS
jgi:2-phosphosulfolactate phosphatase